MAEISLQDVSLYVDDEKLPILQKNLYDSLQKKLKVLKNARVIAQKINDFTKQRDIPSVDWLGDAYSAFIALRRKSLKREKSLTIFYWYRESYAQFCEEVELTVFEKTFTQYVRDVEEGHRRAAGIGNAQASPEAVLQPNAVSQDQSKQQTSVHPWLRDGVEERFEGQWIGALVAAATIANGADFTLLLSCLPEQIQADWHSRDRIKQACMDLCEGSDARRLAPMQPSDEAYPFFLDFFRNARDSGTFREIFIGMCCVAARSSGEFEQFHTLRRFTKDVATYLTECGLEDEAVREQWRLMAEFLEPAYFPSEFVILRCLASVALIEFADAVPIRILDIEQGDVNDELRKFCLRKVDLDDLTTGIQEEPLVAASAFAWVRYYCLKGFMAADARYEKLTSLALNALSRIEGAREPPAPSPLHIAIGMDSVPLILFALRQSEFDPNSPAKDGLTPLLMAIANSRYNALHLLLEDERIDVNRGADNGATPLLFAIAQEDEYAFGKVLDHKDINPNQADLSGKTPAMLASALGNASMHRRIITHRAYVAEDADQVTDRP